MSPVTHLLVGWTVASCAPSLTRRDRAMVTWASVVPDLDGMGLIAEVATRNSAQPLTWWSDYHHILGHNIGFALLCTALAVAFAKHRALTGILVLISFHLHLLCDLIGARGPDGDQWPIPYLLPFSHGLNLTWAGQWPLNGWPNVALTAVLITVAIFLAVRRGYSPVDLFSQRADKHVAVALQRRLA
jgi:inner membrane protein